MQKEATIINKPEEVNVAKFSTTCIGVYMLTRKNSQRKK
jgi:hypothetical protein